MGRRKEEGSSRPGTGACLWSVGFVCAREWIGAVVVVQVGREGGREGGAQKQCAKSTRTNTQHRRQALVEHLVLVLDLVFRKGRQAHNNQHTQRRVRQGRGAKVSCVLQKPRWRSEPQLILGARAGEAKVAVGTRKRVQTMVQTA